jgi:hypothetical protein
MIGNLMQKLIARTRIIHDLLAPQTEQYKAQLAKLLRMPFARSSEKTRHPD